LSEKDSVILYVAEYSLWLPSQIHGPSDRGLCVISRPSLNNDGANELAQGYEMLGKLFSIQQVTPISIILNAFRIRPWKLLKVLT